MKLENVKELISIVEDRCDLEQYEGDLGILVKLAKEELEDMSKDTERLSWVSEKQWSGNAIHDAIHWDGRFIRDAIDAAILSDNSRITHRSQSD